MSRPRAARWKPVLAAAAAAALVAAVGATMTDLGPWYQALHKPVWQPPDWLFGPAWTLIFSLTALAGVAAWRDAPDRSSGEWLIVLFAANGILNILWSALFFRLRRPDWALVEVAFLWLSIVVLIIVTARYARTASWLLVPYLAWVSFAAVLTLAVVELNRPSTDP
ncbi:MAG: TspO/MBR family protein [Xanthobacteraceae bacterium]